MNNNQGMYPRRVYIEAIKRAGIPLRLPCVNRSAGPFAIEREIPGGRETQAVAIRVGLEAVASLPEEVRTAIVTERQRHGPYRDLADFRRRVNPGPETLTLLIRCGALDFTGQPRPALFLEAELQQKSESRNPKAEKNKISDFGFRLSDLIAEGWSPTDYAADRRLRDEWELLGFILGPPLMSLFRSQLPGDLVTSRDLPEHVGRVVRVAGLVATARHTPTSDGRDMQFVESRWRKGFPFLSRGEFLLVGPGADPLRCAGRAPALDCARDWGPRLPSAAVVEPE